MSDKDRQDVDNWLAGSGSTLLGAIVIIAVVFVVIKLIIGLF